MMIMTNSNKYTLTLEACKTLAEEGYEYIVERYRNPEQTEGYKMDDMSMVADNIICDTKEEAETIQYKNSKQGCPAHIYNITELIREKEKEEEKRIQWELENNKKQELKIKRNQRRQEKEKEKAKALNLTIEEYRRRKQIERKIKALKKEITELETKLNQG